MYAFLFDKRSLILVGIAVFLIGLLLFGGGLLLGTRLRLDSMAGDLSWLPPEAEAVVGKLPDLTAAPALPTPPPPLEAQPPASSDSPAAVPEEQPEAAPTLDFESLPPAPPPSPEPSSPEPASLEPKSYEPAAPPPSSEPASIEPVETATPDDAIRLTSILETPAPQNDPATEATAQGFTVQVGAYRVQENAEQRRDQLAGHAPYIEEVENAAGEIFYAVRVGPFDSRDQAEVEAAAIRQEIGVSAQSDDEVLVRTAQAPSR